MAMSGGENRRVGSTGEIRVHAQVIDQIASRNESIVRVRGFMRATEGSSTSHGTADMSTSATSGGTRNWSGRSFSIQGQSWQEVVSHDHTVTHRSDGTRPLTATFTLGNTGTSRFGSGGTVSVSFNIDRIPQPPSKPATPSVSNISFTAATVNWSPPALNGAPGFLEFGIGLWWDGGSTIFSAGGSDRDFRLTGMSPNTDYEVAVRARTVAGWSDYSARRKFTTLVLAPDAPSNLSVARVSNTQQALSWTRNATGNAPYASQRVQRIDTSGGSWDQWENVATISGTATSYTDTTTTANGKYRYRIQAVNASGSATSNFSQIVRTTPAAPTSVTARKVGTAIEVTYARAFPASDFVQHEVQDNPGGSGWVTVGTVAGDGAFTHLDPDPTKTHQYRVRTTVPVLDSSGTRLNGLWSAPSAVVQLIAPPLAPSLVGPLGVADRDQPVRLEYQHNPVDTTDQTAGQVRWRPAGGSWTTVSTGVNNFYTLPAPGTSGTFEWQARTRGEHASFGPWSPTWSFNAVSRPEVVIQSPQGTSDQSQAAVEWGYQNADNSAQSRWETQLLDAEGSVLATGSGSNTATSHLFPTILDDATEYTVRVRARSGSGLWSEWDTSTFTTDFPLPYPVEVLPEWNIETGSVSITFQVDDSDATEQAPDSVDVQRDDGDGWITIATGLDPETSIVDHTPRLATVRYRTISRTILPTARTGPETVIEWEHGSADPVYVNGGPSFEDVATAIGHEVTDTPDIEQALQEWAGWNKATAAFGTGQSYAVQFQGNIFPNLPGLDNRSTREEWHELLLKRGIVCYRDCQGRKIFGLLGLNFSSVSGVTKVTISISEVHHVEGVRAVLPIPEMV